MQLFQIQPKDLFEYVFRLDIIHRNHWVLAFPRVNAGEL